MSDNEAKKEVRVWCDGWYVYLHYYNLCVLLMLTKSRKWRRGKKDNGHLLLLLLLFHCHFIRSWWHRNGLPMGGWAQNIHIFFIDFLYEFNEMNHDDEITKRSKEKTSTILGWISLIAIPFQMFHLISFQNQLFSIGFVSFYQKNFPLTWMSF